MHQLALKAKKEAKHIPAVNPPGTVYIKQVRCKKRSLHEATPRKERKEPNRKAARNVKNVKAAIYDRTIVTKDAAGKYVKTKQRIIFSLYDKVSVDGKVGWICGFVAGAAYVKDFNGKYIPPVTFAVVNGRVGMYIARWPPTITRVPR